MKMPTPKFLIATPNFVIKPKITLWWMEDSFLLTYSLLINNYKSFNSNVWKQVLNLVRHFIGGNMLYNQHFNTIIRVTDIGDLLHNKNGKWITFL